MTDDADREFQLLAARRRAEGDQSCEAARDAARLIAAFRDELSCSQMSGVLADELTREYALGVLDPRASRDEDGEE